MKMSDLSVDPSSPSKSSGAEGRVAAESIVVPVLVEVTVRVVRPRRRTSRARTHRHRRGHRRGERVAAALAQELALGQRRIGIAVGGEPPEVRGAVLGIDEADAAVGEHAQREQAGLGPGKELELLDLLAVRADAEDPDALAAAPAARVHRLRHDADHQRAVGRLRDQWGARARDVAREVDEGLAVPAERQVRVSVGRERGGRQRQGRGERDEGDQAASVHVSPFQAGGFVAVPARARSSARRCGSGARHARVRHRPAAG